MTNRSKQLLDIRPNIATAKVFEAMSAEEIFQNKTLRPIIKLQHELFIAVFMAYIKNRKNEFYALSLPKQLTYIDQAVHRDMKFRNALKGMVIGQFTIEEYIIYTRNCSGFNKRMMAIIKERLVNSIQVLIKTKNVKTIQSS